MRRVFLGWREPARISATDFLWRRYALGHQFDVSAETSAASADGSTHEPRMGGPLGPAETLARPGTGQRAQPSGLAGVWDLSDVVLVAPGGRAGRQLLETITARAQQEGVALFPPHVTTVGQLPERLYRERLPFATSLVQQLAWAATLRDSPPLTLREFLADVPTEPADSRWWELGTLLWRQHRELAADGLDFQRVAAQCRPVGGDAERRRWQALAQIQQAYLRRLDDLGLWDRQTARQYALAQRECQTSLDIILVAVVDMNLALRQMLQQVTDRVTALVYADSSWYERFDELGCVVPEKWQAVELPIRDQDLVQVDRPEDQARAVVDCLRQLGGRYAAAQITLGMPDESLVPMMQRELAAAGVRSRFGPGRSTEATRPVRLLRALVDWLDRQQIADLSDLLRHPDVAVVLQRRLRARAQQREIDEQRGTDEQRERGEHTDRDPQSQWAQQLSESISAYDGYCRDHLPVTRSQLLDCLARSPVADETAQRTADLVTDFLDWLEPLSGAPRAAVDWVAPLLDLAADVYGDLVLDPGDESDRRLLGGCDAWRDGLLELQRVPRDLCPPITASQAALLALSCAPNTQVAALPLTQAVELLGWLELLLDDAPVLIVTSFNEGSVPQSTTSDLFLPDGLRSTLGLDDNSRRYARDAYALATAAKTRAQLRLLFTRRDDLGNPRLPSRLLFATGDEQRVARCLRFFGEAPSVLEPAAGANPPDVSLEAATAAVQATASSRPAAGFFVPPPTYFVPTDTMNVTDFKLYMACPYRYYLMRIARLHEVPAVPLELDGAAFGNRMHEVLEAFGVADVRDETDSARIEEFLRTALAERIRTHYGVQPRPVIRLQAAQLALRLQRFAGQQAEWRQQGWQIYLTEGDQRAVTTQWQRGDERILLRGRIDRVDRHEETGQFMILDYKSSEAGIEPRQAHHRGRFPTVAGDWTDLQLPLYRHFAGCLGLSGQIGFGFVALPRAASEAGFHLADWTPAELALADEAAWEVIRAVRAGVFWPPRDPSPLFSAALDRICQQQVFGRLLMPMAGTATREAV